MRVVKICHYKYCMFLPFFLQLLFDIKELRGGNAIKCATEKQSCLAVPPLDIPVCIEGVFVFKDTAQQGRPSCFLIECTLFMGIVHCACFLHRNKFLRLLELYKSNSRYGSRRQWHTCSILCCNSEHQGLFVHAHGFDH